MTKNVENLAVKRAAMLDPDIETLPRSEMLALQGEKLARQVKYVDRNSPFFHERWEAAGASPRDIRSVEDLTKLPTFSKEELRVYRNKTGDPFAGTCCVPAEQLTLVTHSSGTSGKPNMYGLTLAEYEEVGHIFARSSYTVGLRPGDHVVHISGLRWHGTILGWDKAFEQMGVVKYYMGNSTQDVMSQTLELGSDLDQMDALFTYQPEAELQYLRETGLDVTDLFPKLKLLWSAVDASPARRKLLRDTWNVPFKNQYGSGDQFWMTGECPHDFRQNHAPDDYFIFEVLDPITKQAVPDGETGQLHITNLFAKSFPYIRYNMEDMVAATTTTCSCGRTSTRLRVRGREAWSVRIGEEYVFSQEVEDVLWDRPGMAGSNYQLVRLREQPQGRLIVRVVPNQEAVTPGLKTELEDALADRFGVEAEVRIVSASEIGMKGIKMERLINED